MNVGKFSRTSLSLFNNEPGLGMADRPNLREMTGLAPDVQVGVMRFFLVMTGMACFTGFGTLWGMTVTGGFRMTGQARHSGMGRIPVRFPVYKKPLSVGTLFDGRTAATVAAKTQRLNAAVFFRTIEIRPLVATHATTVSAVHDGRRRQCVAKSMADGTLL